MDKVREIWSSILGEAFTVKAGASLGLIMAAMLVWFNVDLPDGNLHVHVLTLDDGLATLITTPSGRQVLVNAGGSGRRLSTELGDAMPFWDRTLDLVVITESSANHTDGLSTILRRYEVDAYITRRDFTESMAFEGMRNAMLDADIPLLTAEPGMTVDIGDGVLLTIIDTDTEREGGAATLMLVYEQAGILLPGDLAVDTQAGLLESAYVLDATILVVPAIGQVDFTETGFLAAVNPQVSVLAVPTGRSGGRQLASAIMPQLEAVGAEVWRTDEAGTIELVTDRETVDVWPSE